MPPDISIVIIDSDPDSLKNIVGIIQKLGNHSHIDGTAATFEKGLELIHKKRPMVVIMDICEDVDLSIERIKTILNRFPQISIFATCRDKSSDIILRVMRAGAVEFLLKPVSEVDLTAALQKLGRLWVVKPAPEEKKGRMITVFSPKGGVGTTTIAINLAYHIYTETKEPTILLDMDFYAGDVATFLNLKPAYTLSDVTAHMSRLDKSFLQGVITKHKSGMSILAEPHKINEVVEISAEDLRKIISLLKTMYKYIVVDSTSVFDNRTKAILEESDEIYVVFVLSLPSINNVRRYIDYFASIGFGRDKVRLVVNRYIKKGEITLEDAERVLNYPIFLSISNEYETAMASINKGEVVDELDPKSRLNLSLKELAKKVLVTK